MNDGKQRNEPELRIDSGLESGIGHRPLETTAAIPQAMHRIMDDVNLYAPPQTESGSARLTPTNYGWRCGPAIPIALGALIGGALGLPLLVHQNPIGFLGVFLGSVVGGIYFRVRSSKWPTDTGARKRRYRYAGLSVVLLPTLTAIATGMDGQGLVMTLFALLIGLSIATGILLSGDRRRSQ